MTSRVSYRRGRRTARPLLPRVGWLGVAIILLAPLSVAGQGRASTGTRFGVTIGGISTVGITAEFFRDTRSIDVTLGTWGFRDVSLSVVGKQYLGSRDVRPYAGAGLWLLLAKPEDARTGLGLVARVPIGLDWSVGERHAVGAALSFNRALAVRRPDPADDLPLNGRLVPLPGLYYRWTR